MKLVLQIFVAPCCRSKIAIQAEIKSLKFKMASISVLELGERESARERKGERWGKERDREKKKETMWGWGGGDRVIPFSIDLFLRKTISDKPRPVPRPLPVNVMNPK